MNSNGRIKAEPVDDGELCLTSKGKKEKRRKKSAKDGLTEKPEKKDKKPVLKQETITDHMPVEKKKRKIDRFNGMPEEEVVLRTLPDHLAPDLDIVIVGINPGLMAAYIGHHYAGPGNHFWKCLYLSGLVPEPKNCYDDYKLLDVGIGFTNICARTTRGSADLKRTEIKEGAEILKEKLREYRPKIAAFNGKGIYEIFSGSKNIFFGKQPELIEGTNTIAYVMPSSSARCAQLPRAIDKVPFYDALRKLRDHVLGRIPHLDDAEVTFPNLELKCVKKEEPKVEEVEASLDSNDNSGSCGGGGGGDSVDDFEGAHNSQGRRAAKTAPAEKLQAREASSFNILPPVQESLPQNGHTEISPGTLTARQPEGFVDSPQTEATFHLQQQHLSLQQQQQHLQHRLWEQQEQSLVGLPQAMPVASSLDTMQSTLNNSSVNSSQMAYSQSQTFGAMSQLYTFASGFSSHQGFDALGFPVSAPGHLLHGQQDGGRNATSDQQVPQVKREPIDANYVQC